MARRKKVTFMAKKEIKKPVIVSFKKSTGERVSFKAKKTVVRPVKITFYVKKGKKK